MLRAEGLGFTYPRSASPALRGLDLEVGGGELAVLAGPSGGGKSTAALGLVGLLGTVVEGDLAGTVEVRGPGPGGDGTTDVGIVLQDPDSHIVTLSVLEEVAFGPCNLALPRAEVLSRVDEALGAVGAVHLRDRPTSELSGGERQRVAIASVLAMEPGVLVMDEPTSNLDARSRDAVLSLVADGLRREDRALVVAEHRLDRLLGVAREVVVLSEGAASWRGSPEDLVADAAAVSGMGVRVPGRPDLWGIGRPAVRTGGPALRVRGLRAGYDGREVLAGLDLEVASGELLGLVGPNGGGKTTLLRCVMGLLEPWEGSVEVGGNDVTGARPSTLAREVGLVFQTPDHQLFASTVQGELEFGPRNMGLLDGDVARRIEGLAREYGLSALADRHPHRLSLGQKRRLNVASVQSAGPRLLLLDEPFIGQDLGSIRALDQRLQAARRHGAAVLVVSHDLEVLTLMADRCVVLEGGAADEVDDLGALAAGEVTA